MELEKLEVLLEINTQRVEESIRKVMPQIDGMLKRIEQATGRSGKKIEGNIDISDSTKKAENNLDGFVNNFSKQLDRMEAIAKEKSTSTSRQMETGFKHTRIQAGKEIDLMVKDINAKLGQAKAAQGRIAELTARRSAAVKDNDTGSIVKYDDQIAAAEHKMTSYRNKAIAMARSMKAEFEAVPNSLSKIAETMDLNEARIETMRAKVANMQKMYETQRKTVGSYQEGFGQKDSPESLATMQKIQKETAQMNKLILSNDQLQKAYATTEDRARILRSALERLNGTLNKSSIQTGNASLGMKNVARQSDEARSMWTRFGGLFNRTSNNIAHGAKNISSQIGSFFSMFNRSSNRTNKGLSKSNQNLNKYVGGWRKTIWMLANQLIVFTMLYRGIMALGKGLWNSLKANEEFASSLNQIKVNLLTAFYPIYQAVLPAVNSLMSALAKATGYIAAFIATIFGTTYEAAKKGAEGLYENVKALDETGSSASKAKEKADELKRSLMGFDEINRIGLEVKTEDDKLDDGLNFGTPDVAMPAWLSNFANMAKSVFGRLFDPVKAAWDKNGKVVMDSFKYALNESWGLVKAIGNSFLEVWANGTGEQFVSNLLQLLAMVLNIIGDIAKAFKDAWEDNGRGTKLIQSVFNMWNSVLELLLLIGDAFRNVWNDGTGERIAGNILEIYTNVADTIGALADGFSDAWKEAGNGNRIFEEILGFAEDVAKKLNGLTQSTKEWAEALDFGPLLSGIAGMLSSLRPILSDVLDGLGWIYENILLPIAKWAIENIIPVAIDVISAAFGLLGGVIDALKPALQWLWDDILQPIASWTGGVIVSVLEAVAGVLERIGDFISRHQAGFSNFVLAFSVFAGTLVVISGAMKVVGILSGVFTGLSAIGGLSGVIGAVTSSVGGVIAILGGPWALAIGAAVGVGVVLWKNWDKIKEKASELGGWISEKWSGIKETTSTFFGKTKDSMIKNIQKGTNLSEEEILGLETSSSSAFGGIYDVVKKLFPGINKEISDNSSKGSKNASDRFREMKDNLSNRGKEAWSATQGHFSNIQKWVSDKSTSAKTNASNAFSNLRTNIGTHFGNIRANATDVWNNVASKISNKSSEARVNAVNAFSNMKARTGEYLSAIRSTTQNTFNQVASWANGLGGRIASGLRGGLDAVKKAAASIGNGIVGTIGKAVNGVISGINWVLDKVGASKSKLSPWAIPAYARGTNAHMGGPALVNDGAGSKYREAFQLPNGQRGLFPQQRNLLVNLPKGSKVLSGPKTHEMYGGVPHYAGGIGDWMKEKWNGAKQMAGTVWDYVTNPSKLVDIAISKFVNLSKAAEPALSIAKGGIGTMAKAATSFVKGFLDQGDPNAYSGRVNFPGLIKTDSFGYRTHPITGQRTLHRGVDYGGGTGIGHPIPAQAPGTVTSAGVIGGGYGTAVKLKNGVFDYLYGHLSKTLVRVGEYVNTGKLIGLMGNTGMSTGPHVHYEVHKNGQPVNPETEIAGSSSEPRLSGSGIERWRSTIVKALSMNGLPTSTAYVNAWLRQVQTESGGNEKAVQSPNVVDVNTLAGNPAKGLLQTIPQTFNAYKFAGYGNIFNGFHNALAAINYAKNRYGTSGMLGVIGQGHGYENGGIVSNEGYYRLAEGNKKELVIPLERRNRALELLDVAKEYLGVEDYSASLQMPETMIDRTVQKFEPANYSREISGGVNGTMQQLMLLLSELNNNSSGNGEQEIVLKIDRTTLGTVVIKEINHRTKQGGESPLKI